MKKNQLFKIILTAVLVALNVILERFMPSYSVWNNNISFGFITVAFSACYLGIPYAIAVGGLGDLIGAVIKPFGPYFVGYTITNMLVGFILAIFLYKKATVLRISIATVINKVVCSLLLNTIFISVLYRGGIAAFWVVFVSRIPFVALMTAVEIITISLLFTQKSKVNKLILKNLPN
ncbi:MAG: folate family ECF transporter S component [Ruminococcaceae bacterium]|nr:folate family ECF transporter S component [Oscillospiraceae bacterium]